VSGGFEIAIKRRKDNEYDEKWMNVTGKYTGHLFFVVAPNNPF